MECTEENVIELIELYKTDKSYGAQSTQCILTKLKKKQDARGGTGKRNEQTRRWVQKEN
jgi:hypothetical protein